METRMKKSFYILGCLLLVSGVASAAEQTIEGRLDYLVKKTARINGQSYEFNASKAKCRTPDGAVTCGTLLGVGYADWVRATISNDEVIELEVIKLSQ
jgi:hypothetical protein